MESDTAGKVGAGSRPAAQPLIAVRDVMASSHWYGELLGWPEQSWYAAIRQEDLPGRGKLLIGEPWAAPSVR